MVDDKITKKLERRNAELQRLNDAEERWHKKLMRAVNAIDKIRIDRKRLLKPRKLEPHESSGDIKDWHKIREEDFGDTCADL